MRTIAYNVYACDGWPRERTGSGNGKPVSSELAEALIRLEPDIVTFSEAPAEATVREIARRLGHQAVFFPSGRQWPGALLTRYPVQTSMCGREISDDPAAFSRHAGRVTVTGPRGEMAVYSAHLHVNDAPIRCREIAALLASVSDDIDSRRAVLLQGDLNHEPTDPEYGLWESAGLTDTWVARGTGTGPTIKADAPERRIDYIWACAALAPKLRDVRVLSNRPFGAGGDGAASPYYLSDHLPVLAEFAFD